MTLFAEPSKELLDSMSDVPRESWDIWYNIDTDMMKAVYRSTEALVALQKTFPDQSLTSHIGSELSRVMHDESIAYRKWRDGHER